MSVKLVINVTNEFGSKDFSFLSPQAIKASFLTLRANPAMSLVLCPWVLISTYLMNFNYMILFIYLFVCLLKSVKPVVFMGRHIYSSARIEVNSNLFLEKVQKSHFAELFPFAKSL